MKYIFNPKVILTIFYLATALQAYVVLKFLYQKTRLGKRLLKEKGKSWLHLIFLILFFSIFFVLMILMRYAQFVRTSAILVFIGLFIFERLIILKNDFSLYENGLICSQGVVLKKDIKKVMWVDTRTDHCHLQLELFSRTSRTIFVTQKISEKHVTQIDAYFNIHRYS